MVAVAFTVLPEIFDWYSCTGRHAPRTHTHRDQVSVSGSHIFVPLVSEGVMEQFNSPAGGSVGVGRCKSNCC